MYLEKIKNYVSGIDIPIVEVPADEIEQGLKIYLKSFNAGERMHLYYIYDNDLKSASMDEKALYSLMFMMCDKDGNRTENPENYGALCDLPLPLLQRLMDAQSRLINSEEVKKSSEQTMVG